MKIPHFSWPSLSTPLSEIRLGKIVDRVIVPLCGWGLLIGILLLILEVAIETKGVIFVIVAAIAIMLLGIKYWIDKFD